MYGFTEGKQRYWFIRNPNEENLTQVLEIAESFLVLLIFLKFQ